MAKSKYLTILTALIAKVEELHDMLEIHEGAYQQLKQIYEKEVKSDE